jgi:hypothetical protein
MCQTMMMLAGRAGTGVDVGAAVGAGLGGWVGVAAGAVDAEAVATGDGTAVAVDSADGDALAANAIERKNAAKFMLCPPQLCSLRKKEAGQRRPFPIRECGAYWTVTVTVPVWPATVALSFAVPGGVLPADKPNTQIFCVTAPV